MNQEKNKYFYDLFSTCVDDVTVTQYTEEVEILKV